MIYPTNLQKNIYDLYFKDVRDMNDFNKALQTIPFETLCVLGKEVCYINEKCYADENCILYMIIKENEFNKYRSFPVNVYNMCSQIEHEFLIRYFKEEHFND